MSGPINRGALLALTSALLFGASPALSKFFAGDMPFALLAGLLYLGSATGLLLRGLLVGEKPFQGIASLPRTQTLKVAGAIVFGGILAPLSLAYAILNAGAFEVSVLLNLEAVATSAVAWLLFHEHVPGRVWGCKALVLAGAIWISVSTDGAVGFSWPALAAMGAALLWAFDNNLTRDVEELPAPTLAILKGLIAGSFNVALGIALSEGQAAMPAAANLGSILVIGALGYGVSLVLFIRALRLIGAARTGTLFAAGPFFGMILSVLVFGESPPVAHWIGAALIALGVWLLIREQHEHEHFHEATSHSHEHSHDGVHHSHKHEGPVAEPHDHAHAHDPVYHSHPHWPDIHHRHSHENQAGASQPHGHASAVLRPFEGHHPGQLTCSVSRHGSKLDAEFTLAGTRDLTFEREPVTLARTDGLWRGTCFEIFVAAPGGKPYVELNVAVSGAWNAYLFDDYRSGMRNAPLEGIGIRPVLSHDGKSLTSIHLQTDLSSIEFLVNQKWELGISAVLSRFAPERIEYWAAAHKSEKPDFHQRAAFVVPL